jgi:replicative DNA helicase
MVVNHNNLTEYGNLFQIKVLSALYADPVFVEKVVEALEPEYFDGENKQFIVKLLVDTYRKYDAIPSKAAIQAETAKIGSEELKKSVMRTVLSILEHMEDNDLEVVKDQFIDFCKNQKMTQAILKSVDLIKAQDFESIRKNVEDALQVGIDTDLGYDYNSDFDKRYSEDVHFAIPTPWPEVNRVSKGGPGKGNLAVVMMPPGVGKSWTLAALGAEALKNGFNVLHITLELSDLYLARRYDTILSGVHIDELDKNKEKVAKIINRKNKGNLRVKQYDPRSVGAVGIKGLVQRAIRLGMQPDVLIVDYGDLIRLSGKGERRHQLEELYEDLRSIGRNCNCLVWTASQVNRSNSKENYIDSDGLAEAYAKANPADFIFTANRPVDLRDSNLAFGFIAKSRLGPDKVKYVGVFDTNYGKIELFLENSTTAERLVSEANMCIEQNLREDVRSALGAKMLPGVTMNGQESDIISLVN